MWPGSERPQFARERDLAHWAALLGLGIIGTAVWLVPETMKQRITISVDEHLATKINELAERSGLSSSAVVNTCLRYALPHLENGPILNPSSSPQPRGSKPVSVLLVEDSDTDVDLLIR